MANVFTGVSRCYAWCREVPFGGVLVTFGYVGSWAVLAGWSPMGPQGKSGFIRNLIGQDILSVIPISVSN